ncbi:MAG: hypothetical protein JWR67_3191 [Mucilaginibacter sp.]|nr:hypothetical protein [Mucilaginibacter sp.]
MKSMYGMYADDSSLMKMSPGVDSCPARLHYEENYIYRPTVYSSGCFSMSKTTIEKSKECELELYKESELYKSQNTVEI